MTFRRPFLLIFIVTFFLAVFGRAWAFESSSDHFGIKAGAINSITGVGSSDTFKNTSAGGQIGTDPYSGILSFIYGNYSGVFADRN